MNDMKKSPPVNPYATIRASLGGLALAVVLVLLGGCAAHDPDDLFSEAVVNAASAQWNEALSTTNKALRSQPSHLPSLILKGLSLHHLQQPVKAEESLRDAAQSATQDFSAQYFYGWILCESEQYQEALTPLRRAHELRPDHPETIALLARCCLELSLPEGVDLLAKLRRNPTYGRGAAIDNGIALLHLSQGDMTRALNHLLAAFRREPGNPVVAQNLAVLYDQYLANPREAMRYYVKALNNSNQAGDRNRVATLRRRIATVSRERRGTPE